MLEYGGTIRVLAPFVVCVLAGLLAGRIFKGQSFGPIVDTIFALVGGYCLLTLTSGRVYDAVNFGYASQKNFFMTDVVQGAVFSVIVAIGALGFIFLNRKIANAWGQMGAWVAAVVLALIVGAGYSGFMAFRGNPKLPPSNKVGLLQAGPSDDRPPLRS